jgi:hypothetical protein
MPVGLAREQQLLTGADRAAIAPRGRPFAADDEPQSSPVEMVDARRKAFGGLPNLVLEGTRGVAQMKSAPPSA